MFQSTIVNLRDYEGARFLYLMLVVLVVGMAENLRRGLGFGDEVEKKMRE
jgi:hypothetical protein